MTWQHLSPERWPASAQAVCPLPEEAAHHLGRVLRLAPGSPLTLFDGQGGRAQASLGLEGKRATARLEGPRRQEAPLPGLGLVLALAKGDKPEWAIQKATELGATWIGLGLARRSVARPDAERAEGKLARWRAIALEACAQSERSWVPELAWLGPLAGPCWPPGHQALVLEGRDQEGALVPSLGQAWQGGALTLLVGPEGGWHPEELGGFQAAGAGLARLGRQVLRAETAALAGLAAIQGLREAGAFSAG